METFVPSLRIVDKTLYGAYSGTPKRRALRLEGFQRSIYLYLRRNKETWVSVETLQSKFDLSGFYVVNVLDYLVRRKVVTHNGADYPDRLYKFAG